jgi:hypothetical protein
MDRNAAFLLAGDSQFTQKLLYSQEMTSFFKKKILLAGDGPFFKNFFYFQDMTN